MQAVCTLDQIKRRLHPVLKKNKVRKATIFGSYSKGLATAEAISIIL
jgi:predicted nucleotidyltransferase